MKANINSSIAELIEEITCLESEIQAALDCGDKATGEDLYQELIKLETELSNFLA